MEKRSGKGRRLFRATMAAVLACGLMMPAGAFATDEGDPPPLTKSTTKVRDLALGALSEAISADDNGVEEKGLSAGVATRSANPFTVVGGTEGAESGGGDYYYDSTVGTLHIRTSTPLTISTAAQTSSNIEIDAGVRADLTLAGVDIATPANGTTSPINMVTNVFDTADGSRATHADQIIHKTSLYLTLADGSSNTLSCLNKTKQGLGSPGIRCGWGSVLVVDDSVRNLDSSNNIVEPLNGMVGQTVTLSNGTTIEAGSSLDTMDSANPGTLTVNAGGNSAGIGSGPRENAGTLIFNGGNVNVNGCNQNIGDNYSPDTGNFFIYKSMF